MSFERTIRRYTAYLRGWCQAFGEHDGRYSEQRPINWLVGDGQVGLIVRDDLRKTLHRKLLGGTEEIPTLTLDPEHRRIANLGYQASATEDQEGLTALIGILKAPDDVHMYLTYHFAYAKGTRIITFSRKGPLHLIYKEMAPLRVQIGT